MEGCVLEGFAELDIQHVPKGFERRFHLVQTVHKIVPRIQLRSRLFITATDLKLPIEKAFDVFRAQDTNQHRLTGARVVESQFGLFVSGKTSGHREIEGTPGEGR